MNGQTMSEWQRVTRQAEEAETRQVENPPPEPGPYCPWVESHSAPLSSWPAIASFQTG